MHPRHPPPQRPAPSPPTRWQPVETGSLGVWVGVGTRNEPAEVNGVSHLLEHMAFKGTERRTALAIAEEIEAVGGHLNAYTAREHTAYYAKVLKEDVRARRSTSSATSCTHSTFERRGAGARARRDPAGDRPGGRHAGRHHLRPFPVRRLSRPADGPAGAGHAEDVISRCRATMLTDYMRRHYRAERMVLAAAGEVDHEQAASNSLQRPSATCRRRPGAAARPPRYSGGEFREERDLEQVHIVLGFPGGRLSRSATIIPPLLLSTLLGGGMSSRLFQEVREKRGLVYSDLPFAASFQDGGLFGVYAGTGEKEAAEIWCRS